MTEERTPDQIKADEELSQAIMNVCEAYGTHTTEHTMLTDFLVMGRSLGYRDGEEIKTYFKLFPKGGTEVDWDTALGMARRAQVELEREYVGDGTEEED